ncbi:MAG TPA: hypothetical protein GX731_10440 [Clostridiales bacterium]|nr:hypothetical protein [Clostridiales bacterium]
MREIKFRVWDKNERVMYPPEFVTSIDLYEGFIELGEETYGEYTELLWDKVLQLDECEMLQYTGINDENGTEIYEGDVLRWSSEDNDGSMLVSNEQVIYNDGRFVMLNEKGQIVDLLKDAIKYNKSYEKVELVGNAYENKELLEKKEGGNK